MKNHSEILIFIIFFIFLFSTSIQSATLDKLLSPSLDYQRPVRLSGSDELSLNIISDPVEISQFPGDAIVYEGEFINESGYLSIGEFIEEVAGAYVNGLPGQEWDIYSRGGDGVMLMVDGTPLNELSGSSVDLTGIPLEGIEKLEIYSGPVSFLNPYMRGVNLVINIIMKPESLEAPESFIFLSDGTSDLERYKFNYSMSVKDLDFSVSGNRTFYTGLDYYRGLSRGAFEGAFNLSKKRFDLSSTFLYSSGQYNKQFTTNRINDRIISFQVSPTLKLTDDMKLLTTFRHLSSKYSTKERMSDSLHFGLSTRFTDGFSFWGGGYIDKRKDTRPSWAIDSAIFISPHSNISALIYTYLYNSYKTGTRLYTSGGITFKPVKNISFYLSSNMDLTINDDYDDTRNVQEIGMKLFKAGILEVSLFGSRLSDGEFNTQIHSTGGRFRLNTPYLLHASFVGYIRDGYQSEYPKRKIDIRLGIDHTFQRQEIEFSTDIIYHFMDDIYLEKSGLTERDLCDRELDNIHTFDFEGHFSISSLNIFFIYENLFNKRNKICGEYFPLEPRGYKWGVMWSFVN